jgi:hypothetical protein
VTALTGGEPAFLRSLAAQAGGADPAGYVRGVLEGWGQLPAAGARPAAIVADARSAMALTGAGWPS